MSSGKYTRRAPLKKWNQNAPMVPRAHCSARTIFAAKNQIMRQESGKPPQQITDEPPLAASKKIQIKMK